MRDFSPVTARPAEVYFRGLGYRPPLALQEVYADTRRDSHVIGTGLFWAYVAGREALAVLSRCGTTFRHHV